MQNRYSKRQLRLVEFGFLHGIGVYLYHKFGLKYTWILSSSNNKQTSTIMRADKLPNLPLIIPISMWAHWTGWAPFTICWKQNWQAKCGLAILMLFKLGSQNTRNLKFCRRMKMSKFKQLLQNSQHAGNKWIKGKAVGFLFSYNDISEAIYPSWTQTEYFDSFTHFKRKMNPLKYVSQKKISPSGALKNFANLC